MYKPELDKSEEDILKYNILKSYRLYKPKQDKSEKNVLKYSILKSGRSQ